MRRGSVEIAGALLVGALLYLVITGTTPRAGASSCARTIQLAFDGIVYYPNDWGITTVLNRPLTEDDLGPEYRRVEQNAKSMARDAERAAIREARRMKTEPTFSTGTNCGTHNNFAVDLPLGTPLHTVRGYDPTFRLAARLRDGTFRLYEAGLQPTDRIGAHLLPIEGRVIAVRVIDRQARTLGLIEDAETVARLVAMVSQAPIDAGVDLFRTRPLTVIYHLDDETSTADRWAATAGDLGSGIQPPAAFHDLLRAAMAEPNPPLIPVAGTPVG